MLIGRKETIKCPEQTMRLATLMQIIVHTYKALIALMAGLHNRVVTDKSGYHKIMGQ